MRARVSWSDGMSFIGETDSNHQIIMDGPPEAGGVNRGPRPMETVLVGAGACTSFDVVYILKNSKQDITGCEAEITAERADTEPKVFTKIHIHFVVRGRNLRESIVKRAIELSATKYCSATIMLAKTAEMTHDYEIIEEST